MSMRFNGMFLLLAFGFLAACGKQTTYDDGPDEFLTLTYKPLQTPASYSNLPEPTPDGVNRADPTPYADAVQALGGQRSLAAPPADYYAMPASSEGGTRRRGIFGWFANLFGR